MTDRASFAVNACVLLHRDDRWLLDTRSPDADYAPDTIGLIGGHLEPDDGPESVVEDALRREVLEETGIDLTGVPLAYLDSELYEHDGRPVITLTFVATLPEGIEPVAARTEAEASVPSDVPPADPASDLAWWTIDDLEADPRCAPWTSRLVRRALGTITGE